MRMILSVLMINMGEHSYDCVSHRLKLTVSFKTKILREIYAK